MKLGNVSLKFQITRKSRMNAQLLRSTAIIKLPLTLKQESKDGPLLLNSVHANSK